MGRLVIALLLFSAFAWAASADAMTEENRDRNLLLAVAQMAGMHVCDQMRNQFRSMSAENEQGELPSSGTLWIETCAAHVEGTRLFLSLGGQGWRWIYQVKRHARAQFEVSQYVSFAVDVRVAGELDAAYDPERQVFHLWFMPSGEPEVAFRPISDVEVDAEGLWSSVVAGAASLFSRSPKQRAREQFRHIGREKFIEQFNQGFTATLDFCTGQVETGFGINGKSRGEDAKDGENGWTTSYMSPGGLLVDGAHAVDPGQFFVMIESDGPMQADLLCAREGARLARAFVDRQPLPEVQSLKTVELQGREVIRFEEDYVACPVVVAMRPLAEAPRNTYGFRYRVNTAPVMEPVQYCEGRSP